MAFNASAINRKVKGLEKLNRQMRSLPASVKLEVSREMELRASRLAHAVRRAASFDPKLAASVDYTKGAPPSAGPLRSTAQVKGDEGLSWYVHEGDEDVFWAQWTEHGTAPHSLAPKADLSRGKRQDVGIQHPGARAMPHFWPTVRGFARPIRNGIAAAGRRAARRAAGGAAPSRAGRTGQFNTRPSKG